MRLAFKTPAVNPLTFPSSPSANSHLRLFGESEASASGVAGVLSEKSEATLLDRISINSRLCIKLHSE